MLEKYLVEHCSPTLASLKTANLFSCDYTCEKELEIQLAAWNRRFQGTGVRLFLLRRYENTALIYVCRILKLQKDLNRPGVARFLSLYGYGTTQAEGALERLKIRLAESEAFPHEIGIFLGYPLGDVIGFIENAGRNYKCSGCWKVYCNECEAARTFAKYNKCRDVYKRLWNQGRSVLQLTVAA